MKVSSIGVGVRVAILVVAAAGAVHWPADASGQTVDGQQAAPPTVIPVSGRLTTPTGEPRTGTVLLTLSLYAEQEDSTPLAIEHQPVTLDERGRYDVTFGSTLESGLPADVFASRTARWLGVAVDAEPEQPRVMLVAVPYAAVAGNAQTLAGRTIEDFVMVAGGEAATAAAKRGSSDDPRAEALTEGFIVKTGGGATDSVIREFNGKIGVALVDPVVRAITPPEFPLDVHGDLRLRAGIMHFASMIGSVSHIPFLNSAVGLAGRIKGSDPQNYGLGLFARAGHGIHFMVDDSSIDAMTLTRAGNLGIATNNPRAKLDVNGFATLSAPVSSNYLTFAPNGVVRAVVGLVGSIKGSQAGGLGLFAETGEGIHLMVNGSAADALLVASNGNVGIGASPNAKLHVNGNVLVNGSVTALNQDVAEWVEASEALEPGTVVVIDPLRDNGVKRSRRSYDSSVAGAVSSEPGVILGEPGPNKVMVAQSGRVRIKADARYGAIKRGDLLVTSPSAGYAMRGAPARLRPGRVLGKALEPLAAGTGEVLVLLTLQ